MAAHTVIVDRNKISISIIMGIIAVFILIIFFIVSIWGLFAGTGGTFEKVTFLLLIAVSFLGLRKSVSPLNKLLSSNPEFEINSKEFIVYDDPSYNKIPLTDMQECKLYYAPQTSVLIGFSLKPESRIVSNANKMQKRFFSIPQGGAKIVFFSLDWAEIKPEELVDLINKRITVANHVAPRSADTAVKSRGLK